MISTNELKLLGFQMPHFGKTLLGFKVLFFGVCEWLLGKTVWTTGSL